MRKRRKRRACLRVLRTSEPIQHTLPLGMNEGEEQSGTAAGGKNYQAGSNTISLAGVPVSHNTHGIPCKADGCIVSSIRHNTRRISLLSN